MSGNVRGDNPRPNGVQSRVKAMESEPEAGDRRNKVLAQSYPQGLSRAAQQNNDVGFSFELPKEVVEKREKEWGNLFAKYTEHSSDDIELNINTMEPVATEEEKEDEDEDDGDEESGEYYSKCRAPMRKLPALIQYWIDTGNPPYQLVGDDDHSETGSSLSEGEHSRTGHSDVLQDFSDKQRPEDVSPYSSVDTAAYILSNTNVTKKSETMAIVEGARKPEEPQIPTVLPWKDNVAGKNTGIGSKDNSSLSSEQDAKTMKSLSQHSPLSPSPRKPIAQYDLQAFSTPPKNSPPDNNFSSPNGSPSLFSPSQRSVKLSEVLPTFRQFDELLDVSRATRSAGAHSSLSRVGRNPKLVVSSPNNETPPALQSSQTSSILPKNLIKPHNRRKLYTGRNSPVDLTLTIERTSIGSVQNAGNCLHPALEPETTETQKTWNFPNRARARKKRKRASQAAELVGNEDNNTSHDSVPPITTEKVQGDMRYSDFFESLGLTPSKTIIGETPVSKPVRRRPRKINKRVKPRKPKKKLKPIDGTGTSIKENGETSQCTVDSVVSPLGQRSSVNDAASKLPVDKILVVRLNKLSDDFLARYKRRGDSDECEKNLENAVLENPSDIGTSSSGSSPIGKKGKASNNENIEVLTTATHDSDSSTILICSCNNDNNEQCSESDNSLFTKDRSKMKKKSLVVENSQSQRSLRSAEHKSLVKMNAEVTRNLDQPTNDSQKSKINKEIKNSPNNASARTVLEKSSKLPRVLVRLEKLDTNDMPKSTKIEHSSRQSRESQKTIFHNNNNNNNNQNAFYFSSSTKSPVQAGNQVGFLRFSSSGRSPEAKNKRVTIARRVTNDFDQNPVKLQKSRATPVRCNLRISIASDEDEKKEEEEEEEDEEEEDRFAKLVKKFGSARRSVKIETDQSKKIIGDELVDDTNVDRVTMQKSEMSTRLRGNFGISMSDEEDDAPMKPVKKAQSKRRGKLEQNADTANEVGYRKKKIVNRSLPADNLDEPNSRKVSSIEKTHGNFDADVTAREVSRRSTRNEKSLSSGDSGESFEYNAQSLSLKPKNTSNVFANAKESNLDDDKALPSRDNRKLESTSDKSGPNATSQFSKSKSRKSLFSKVTRSGRYGKISVRSSLNLARFQTRFDSDSDTDFGTLRFPVDTKNDQRVGKARASANETQTEKSNTEVSEQNVPTRSFQKFIDRRMELSRKTLKLANTSVKNTSDDSQKNSVPTKNGVARVTSSSDNRISSRDEFTTSDESVKTKHSHTKQKNMKLTTVPQIQNSSERSSPKHLLRRWTSLPISSQPDDEQFSPIAKKNSRRTRILGTPMEYESGDNVKLADGKADSDEKLQREKFAFPNSTSAKKRSDRQRKRRGEHLSPIVKKRPRRTRLRGTPVEYESDDDGEPTDGKVEQSVQTLQGKKKTNPNSTSSKKIIDEHDSSSKRRSESKKLFSNSLEEDGVEEIDLMFGCDTKMPAKKCTVLIDSLKFVSGSKRRNLNNMRRSTMSFRTKLSLDSDDDDENNVL